MSDLPTCPLCDCLIPTVGTNGDGMCRCSRLDLANEIRGLRANVQRLVEDRDNWQTAYYEEGRRISHELRVDLATARQRIAELERFESCAVQCYRETQNADHLTYGEVTTSIYQYGPAEETPDV